MARKKAATGSGSILNYFGPKPTSAPASDRPRTPGAASSLSSLSPLSAVTPTPPESLGFPHPGTPADEEIIGGSKTPSASHTPQHSSPANTASRQPVSRDAEIAASDDDDSDDFETLGELLAPRAGPSTPSAKRVNTNQVTPDRRPGSLFSSPLTIQPRVRHFAMDELLKDAKMDSSTEETYKRLQARQEDESKGHENPILASDTLRDTLMDAVGDEEDHRLDKVVRAVERTEKTATKQGWYFFRPTADSEEPNRHPFPAKRLRDICGKKATIKGPRDLDPRLLNFSLKLRRDTLPDELFLWMLDEVCVEKSESRRDEMCKIIHLYPSRSISGHITPSYLEGLFLRLGASEDIQTFLGNKSSEPVNLVGAPEEGLYKRDWRCLCSVLETLLAVSSELEPDTMLYCIQVVLAISVDPELLHDPDVLLLCRKLLLSVASAFPSSEWDSACEYVTTFVYNAFPYPPIRLRSLQFLPTSTKESHELRRRMATAFFFDDLSLVSQPADTSFNLQDITAHLQSPRFKVRPDTDYATLRALLLLLDIAVDTGVKPGTDDPQAGALANAFDAEVDDLTAALRQLARSINDTEMKSVLPMEAKMVMDWVGERLAHAVRSRPKPKISIYDLSDRHAADVNLPKQQNLMKKFLQSWQGESDDKASA